MCWGGYPKRRGRDNNFWVIGLIIFLIAVSTTRSFAPFIPIFIVLFVILPAARRSQASREQDYEKPKYDYDFEKPKRSERYVESDDGTLLEVIDEQPDEDDHTDYV